MIILACSLLVVVGVLAVVVYKLTKRVAYLELDDDSQDHDITDHNARLNELAELWDKKFEDQQSKWDDQNAKFRADVVTKTLLAKSNNTKGYR